jgi:hypothetical protein
MDIIELLNKQNPDYAQGFVQTALRLYAEAITTGSPEAYFQKLSRLDYPGVEKDREAERKLATVFIDWHESTVLDFIGMQTGLVLSKELDIGLSEEEIDRRAELLWLQEMQN